MRLCRKKDERLEGEIKYHDKGDQSGLLTYPSVDNALWRSRKSRQKFASSRRILETRLKLDCVRLVLFKDI